jgi:myo-inositol-hexaphosphate 3-phosphohydrolase
LLETTNYNNNTDQYEFELNHGRKDFISHRPTTDRIEFYAIKPIPKNQRTI